MSVARSSSKHAAQVGCALSIAGLDPGGGAGILADVRAFARAGVWGCAVVSVLTAQSTRGLARAWPVDPRTLIRQLRELLESQDVRSIKTGALGSADNARAVRRLLAHFPKVALVVDPVRMASENRGKAQLLGSNGRGELLDLCAKATLVTPNAAEASELCGRPVRDVDSAAYAGAWLVAQGARAALVKGGHLRGSEVTDVLVLKERTLLLPSKRRDGATAIHGTGCTLSALIAGRLARRDDSTLADSALTEAELLKAVRWAKGVLGRALASPVNVGAGQRVLTLDRLRPRS